MAVMLSPLKLARPPEGLTTVVPASVPEPDTALRLMTAWAPEHRRGVEVDAQVAVAVLGLDDGLPGERLVRPGHGRWLGGEDQLGGHGVEGDPRGLEAGAGTWQCRRRSRD